MNKKKWISFVSLMLSFALMFSFLPKSVFAQSDMIVDGHQINILENSGNRISVSLEADGEHYVLHHDLFSSDYSLEQQNKTFFRNITGKSDEKKTYKINVYNSTSDHLSASVVGKDGEFFHINESLDEIQAQASLVIGVGVSAAAAALLKAILALLAAVVIAGVTWYTASKVIEKLKRDQPDVKYYTARLFEGSVVIGAALKTKSAAAARLRGLGSVFAIASGYAYDACKSASPISQVSGRQKHGTGQGNFWHYHPMLKPNLQSSAHCWYI